MPKTSTWKAVERRGAEKLQGQRVGNRGLAHVGDGGLAAAGGVRCYGGVMAIAEMTVDVVVEMLVVSWRGLSKAEHDRTVQALRGISKAYYDADLRAWRVPLRQADRVLATLPHASYSYDALCAAVAAEEGRIDRFMRNLRALGVHFEVQAGQVMVRGPHVSPLVQQLVAERNAAALAWLRENPAEQAAAPAPLPQPLLDGEAALLATSLRNAAKKQQRGSNGADTGGVSASDRNESSNYARRVSAAEF